MRKWGKIVCVMWMFILLLSGCYFSEPVEPDYFDVLESGLGLSEDAAERRYQFDQGRMEVERPGRTIWYPAETVKIAGYDSELRLEFEFEKGTNKLIEVDYIIPISGEGEELARGTYDAMLAVFYQLEDDFGAIGDPEPGALYDRPEIPDLYESFENFYEKRFVRQENYSIESYWYLDEYGEGKHAGMQVLSYWEEKETTITVWFASDWD